MDENSGTPVCLSVCLFVYSSVSKQSTILLFARRVHGCGKLPAGVAGSRVGHVKVAAPPPALQCRGTV